MGGPMNQLLRSWALATVALSVALPGCGEEKKKQDVAADAGADQGPQKPQLDGKLAAAVKAAESAQASSPSKAGADGPPESGIFGPGLADKAASASAPPQLQVVDNGKEPRLTLTPAPADEQRETASISVKQQRGQAIPVDYVLSLKVDKPKDEKKADGPRPVHVIGKVASLQLPPGLPRDAEAALGKLKGIEIRYTLTPGAGATDLGFTLAKDTDPALGDAFVRGLLETVSVSMPPVPSTPVGVGAYWMVTDRSSTFGIDVVRYRVYKVEKIEKDLATITVDVRQYAAKEETDLGGQKMTASRFESKGKGRMEWAASALMPPRAETSVSTGLAGSIATGQQGMFQAEVAGKFTAETGEKKK